MLKLEVLQVIFMEKTKFINENITLSEIDTDNLDFIKRKFKIR